MNLALMNRLRPVTRRLRSIRFWWSMAAAALLLAVAGWMMKGTVDSGRIEGQTLALVLGACFVVAGLIVAAICRFSFRNPREVAGHIENRFPSLNQRLLTALSQKDDQLGYLQQRVIKEARDHSWRVPAREYEAAYRRAISERR